MHRGAIQPMGIMAGKFQGAMPAKTPRGSRYWVVSKPRVQFIRAGPFIRCGMPQANSTTSVTFSTSPMASFSTLPFSRARSRVNSSRCRSSSAFIRNSTCTRVPAGVSAQAGNAAWADSTASSTSPAVLCGASAITAPVEGSKQSMYRVALDSRHSPSMQIFSFPVIGAPPRISWKL